MPPTIYLDQNALIYLYQRSQNDGSFKVKLLAAISDANFIIVLSPWHWVETARTKDIQKASQLADFMDELKPVWLRDRRDLERIEVEDGFLKFADIPYVQPPALITRPELLSALNQIEVSPERAPSSREFVEGWIKKPELMVPIVHSYQKNEQALIDVRSALASGKLTAAKKAEGDRKLIESFLPRTTPGGVVLDAGTKSAYLDEVTLKDFPSISIEAEIAEYSWANQGRTDWNSMVDKFHLISALPHVDVVVSDDRYFYLMLATAQKTGFVKARVLKFAKFCKEFLP